MALTRTPLYQTDHPYYCEEQNYHLNYMEFEKYIDDHGDDVDEFLDTLKGHDKDYNLLFRWDWNIPEQSDITDALEDGEEVPVPELVLFFFMQRKGTHFIMKCQPTIDDEPRIYEALVPFWDHLRLVWEGVS